MIRSICVICIFILLTCIDKKNFLSAHTHTTTPPPLSQEPSVPEPQQEEPPTESQDHTPGQKREEDQGAAEIQVPNLEADLQELSQSKTGDECRDSPDVQGKILPKSEQFKMPEGEEGKPQL
ncbi:XAGE5 isoform 3 [Pongo abelii]|uniref:XAGE5 isoform 3 n=2 Tax=Pongo abelii TaxID=9601 RepID=A0A2J8RNG1_PONAB|nr:XAGE5 isoform 3 [Pongo abelii]